MVTQNDFKSTQSIRATNIGPVFYRTFTDIPLSKEIYRHTTSLRKKGAFVRSSRNLEFTLPYMEARYKAIDAMIHKLGINQIVEIAAGWSPRGMIFTIDSKINFIETDQDQNEINEKEQMVHKMIGKRKNLTIVRLDAITGDGLDHVLKILKQTPTAIVHEGLLRYLTHKQKKAVALTIRSILEKTGGIYITPDIMTKSNVQLFGKEQTKKFKEHSLATNTDMDANMFKDEDEAIDFYKKCGFNTEIIKFKKLVFELSCLKTKDKTINLHSMKIAAKNIMKRDLWIMNKI